MKVSELIAQLAKCNPNAEVSTWAVFANGEPADNVSGIEVFGVANWSGEDNATQEEIMINLLLPE